MSEKLCPCCGRHCSLDDPHCERGKKYAETGEIPTENRGEEHGESGCHGRGHGHCRHDGHHRHEGGGRHS